MAAIDIIVPLDGLRRWHRLLLERLAEDGFDIRLVAGSAPDPWPATLTWMLAAEERLSRAGGLLFARETLPSGTQANTRPGATVIDLAEGGATNAGALGLLFNGGISASNAAIALAEGRSCDLTIVRDGLPVGAASPMVDSRLKIGHGMNDILAAATSLIASTVHKAAAGELAVLPGPFGLERHGQGSAARATLLSALPRLARETLRRTRYWRQHWRVGYRFHDGPGVAETGLLGGSDWSILPDDGLRYYADPFPFEHESRHFLFVEEYPHHGGKGLISVAEFDADGRPGTPRVVIEEPHHLSYPQVFRRDGAIWMMPESGGGRELVLYRASAFPDEWTRHCVLVADREIYDATLLEHGNRLWLFATERRGIGSSSDMLVVFHAERLEGPWLPHKANPILIDRAAARPGGAFVKVGRRIVRPVQDGTDGYGGGLGLSDVVRLDLDEVRLSRPVPILGSKTWPHPQIHTLNRAGRLEVIDGLADVRKARRQSSDAA